MTSPTPPALLKNLNAVCYLRVSTEEQAREGISLAAQEERCKAYCKMYGLNMITVVREEGVSASKPLSTRPAGSTLQNHLQNKCKHVVAFKLDRLFRDTRDCLTQVEEWEDAGVIMHIVDMGGMTLSTNSAVGRMFLTMVAAFAEFERHLVSERTKAALAHKKARGEYVGGVPIECCPGHEGIAEKAIALRREGLSYNAIAKRFKEGGVPTKYGGAWDGEKISKLIKRNWNI